MSIDRRPYNFDEWTKLTALTEADYSCQLCGKNHLETSLQVHHLIPIWFVVNYLPSLSAELIKDLANAIVLCDNCHAQTHKDESVVIYKALAIKAFNVNYSDFTETDYGFDRLERIYGKLNKPDLKMVDIQASIDDLDEEQAYWVLHQVLMAMDT